jgi:hypothetical protein
MACGGRVSPVQHNSYGRDHGRRGLPSETLRIGEAVAGAGRSCARIAVSAQPHWCRAIACSYWMRFLRCHIVATTLPLLVFFLRHVAHCSSAPSIRQRVRRCKAPGVSLRSICTLFSHDVHTIFTPCEVAGKSLVSDATYDGRHGSSHPYLARRGRCRNRTPTPRFHSSADI